MPSHIGVRVADCETFRWR